jgi:hypothetical protein
VDVTRVDDDGTFSRMLENILLMSSMSMTKVGEGIVEDVYVND